VFAYHKKINLNPNELSYIHRRRISLPINYFSEDMVEEEYLNDARKLSVKSGIEHPQQVEFGSEMGHS
jgi:hypothetical protein